MKRTISFLTAFAILLSAFSIKVYASDFRDIVLSEEDMNTNAYMTIENALAEAKSNASDNLVYRIYVPAGTYTLVSGLHIYSNTQLYLDKNTVLNRGFESGNMIKAGLKGELTREYSGYKNIVIDGGVWNSQYIGESCAMRFAHCSNLAISNLTIKNIKNAHHIEVAAIDGFNLTGCTFTGTNKTNSSSAEAVQIDILHEYEHFPDYYYYDDTPCKNINVTGCTFSDLYSGIGTRSGVVGSYFENINIVGNAFRNITERAITCFNYRNSKISNNIIDNATECITFEYLPSSNISSRLFVPNSNSVGRIMMNSCSEISGNFVSVNRLSSIECYGIYVYAGEIDSAEAKAYGIPQGKYFIKDLTVTGNSIVCQNSYARGIFLTGVYDSDITSNTLTDYSSASDGINAVNLCASSRNLIKSNVIYGTFNNGISLYGNDDGNSRGNSIDSNSINNLKSYGVRIAGGSTASIKNTNYFSNCAAGSLCIVSKNYSQNLPGVSIKSISRSSSGRALVKWYAVNGADGYKIYRSFTANGTYRQIATVKGNKLMYIDSSSRSGFTYYYKISPYYSVSSCAVISSAGAEKGTSLFMLIFILNSYCFAPV